MKEIWVKMDTDKPYEISNLGRIKALSYERYYSDGRIQIRNDKILKPSLDKIKGYVRVNLVVNNKTKTCEIHRLVAEYFLPNFNKKLKVDHKNHIKTDNRAANLRMATNKQNSANSRKLKSCSSKYKGVFKHKCGKWMAQIMVDRKSIYLGLYSEEKDAAIAYDKAAKKHFGEFAYLNFELVGE